MSPAASRHEVSLDGFLCQGPAIPQGCGAGKAEVSKRGVGDEFQLLHLRCLNLFFFSIYLAQPSCAIFARTVANKSGKP